MTGGGGWKHQTTKKFVGSKNQPTFLVLEETLEAAVEDVSVALDHFVKGDDVHQTRAKAVELAENGVLAARQTRLLAALRRPFRHVLVRVQVVLHRPIGRPAANRPRPSPFSKEPNPAKSNKTSPTTSKIMKTVVITELQQEKPRKT